MTKAMRPTGKRDVASARVARPSVGLALGGGGARGIAHVLMLEAFDELGIKPKIIAGTSIGAIFGAAYASGISAREIRAHAEELLAVRLDLVREVFAARVTKSITGLRDFFSPRMALLAPEALLETVLPAQTARDFADLEIPLKVVASDFYGAQPHVFTDGPLRRAVAASMALPAIFEPVVVDGRALIDGGLTNPLPYDLLMSEVDVTVAIDVSGAPVPHRDRAMPSATEALFASAFIFERTINREKMKSLQPDIYIDAGTSHFQILDVFKVKEILAAAEPAKEKLKAKLARVLEVETLPELASPERLVALAGFTGAPEPEPEKKRSRLMKSLRPKSQKK